MPPRAIIGARRGAGHLSSARGARVIRKGRWGRIAAVTACLCLATTSAATAGSAHHASAKAPVTLNMWWWGDQEAAGLKGFVADSVKKYEAAHPNIKINTMLQTHRQPDARLRSGRQGQEGPGHRVLLGRHLDTLEDALGRQPRADLRLHPARASGSTTSTRPRTRRAASSGRRPWYVQPSFPVLYRKDVLQERGHRRRADDVDAAPARPATRCARRASRRSPAASRTAGSAAGCTRILGSQSLTSIDDLKDAVVGDAEVHRPRARPPGGRGSQQMNDRQVLERRHRLARAVPGAADLGRRQERDDDHGRHRRQASSSSRSAPTRSA